MSTSGTKSNLNHSLARRPILGIVGCGNIGGRQATNFLAHGYSVYVYDINPERMADLQSLGARVTGNCAELAACSDVVFTALPTPADVIQAAIADEQSLSQGLRPGSVYIDITTNSPETVLRLDRAMARLGVEMLDAPFNDCPVGARSQKGMGLAVLASGPIATFNRLQPLLQLMADRVLYCGEIGHGTQCKLIHNAVNAATVQAVSEGITLGLARGIALPVVWNVLRLGSFGQNPGDIHGLDHYWFSRRCDDPSQAPAFTVKLLHKDLRIALDLARERNVPLPQIGLAAQDYEEAERQGWSHYAATKVRCLQEKRAGVTAKANRSGIADRVYQSLPSPAGAKAVPRKVSRSMLLYFALALALAGNLFQLGIHWPF